MNYSDIRKIALGMRNELNVTPLYQRQTRLDSIDIELTRSYDALSLQLTTRGEWIDGNSAGTIAAMFGCPPNAIERHGQRRRRSALSNQRITEYHVIYSWQESFEVPA